MSLLLFRKISFFKFQILLTINKPSSIMFKELFQFSLFVRANILPEGSNVCEVPTKNIIVNDSPEGMQVSFDTAKHHVLPGIHIFHLYISGTPFHQ